MSGTQQEKQRELDRDEALDDTFPASDPPAIGGSTGPAPAQPDDTLEDKPPENKK